MRDADARLVALVAVAVPGEVVVEVLVVAVVAADLPFQGRWVAGPGAAATVEGVGRR